MKVSDLFNRQKKVDAVLVTPVIHIRVEYHYPPLAKLFNIFLGELSLSDINLNHFSRCQIYISSMVEL